MNPKTNLTSENKRLNEYYAEIRKLREGGAELPKLVELEAKISSEYPQDWLSRIEILELLDLKPADSGTRALKKRIEKSLDQIAKISNERRELISRGLALLKGRE
jgi:hypothetical protein